MNNQLSQHRYRLETRKLAALRAIDKRKELVYSNNKCTVISRVITEGRNVSKHKENRYEWIGV